MRDINGDERDVRFHVFRGDSGRDGLVGLKLDDQVHLLSNQVVGVPQGDFRLIAVVHHDELDLFSFGGPR